MRRLPLRRAAEADGATGEGRLFRKSLAVIAVVATSVAVGLLSLLPVTAQQAAEASATRSLNPATVAPGGEVVVTITAANYGSFGEVTETLPVGFTYASSPKADQVEATGQEVRLTLQGETSFTYTVTASSAAGSHTFSGTLRDSDRQDHDVVGDSSVTVEGASEASATRSLNPATVAPGGEVVVTITAANYGSFGEVTETLPVGFTYASSPKADQVEATGQEVRLTLQGETSFTYTVTASSAAGSHTFSGTLRDSDRQDHDVVGDSSVTVEGASEASATRSLNPATVAPGGEVVVTITAANYGSFGEVTETLPVGFAYASSPKADQVEATGQEVRLTLQGETSFTYTVTASSAAGSHTFSGTLRDSDKQDHDVVGDSSVTVEGASEASATRSFNPATVAPGEEVVVTITAANYGSFGEVTETLPVGFTYVSSPKADQVEATGQEVRLTLQGETSFTYTVTASSAAGSHTFSGTLRDSDRQDHDVVGDSNVTVEGPSAKRSFRPITVAPGRNVVVTITAANYGSFGEVTETLPVGFTYVSSPKSDQVEVTGQEVRLTLQGETSFTYTVTASSAVGSP